MTTHTPGKWNKYRTPKGYFICAVSDDTYDKDIIEVYDSEDITTAEFEHNANLVCAAPDLLIACELALALIRGEIYNVIDPENRIVAPALRKAIEKATK
jgi:hypothetical protein